MKWQRNASSSRWCVSVFYNCKKFESTFPKSHWSYLSTLGLHSFNTPILLSFIVTLFNDIFVNIYKSVRPIWVDLISTTTLSPSLTLTKNLLSPLINIYKNNCSRHLRKNYYVILTPKKKKFIMRLCFWLGPTILFMTQPKTQQKCR